MHQIYIPIWFYFNDEGATGEAEADDIYIPIWFYFNVSRVQKNRKLVRIYIPIWFYFNKFVLLQSLVPFQFTFQYGSTSILPALGVISPLLYLHSNMVLLQFSRVPYLSVFISIYIPIWFYFNPDVIWYVSPGTTFTFQYGSTSIMIFRQRRNCCIIYIPIWFYFNEA